MKLTDPLFTIVILTGDNTQVEKSRAAFLELLSNLIGPHIWKHDIDSYGFPCFYLVNFASVSDSVEYIQNLWLLLGKENGFLTTRTWYQSLTVENVIHGRHGTTEPL